MQKRKMSRLLSPGGMSRRELIGTAGKLTAGMAVLAAGGVGLAGRAGAEASSDPLEDKCTEAGFTLAESSEKYPWGYKKIDPNVAAAIAYENWYKNFCCYATASGILIPLKESVGGPYKTLPVEAFTFGHGGTVGWGTLCGTLLGAGLASSFAAGRDGEKILNDVIAWYGDTELPTYNPKNPKLKETPLRNKSNSPLCHISVGKWMQKTGTTFASPQRRDRCARLAADVAFKTATLLNAWADGTYVPVHGSQVKAHQITAQNNCAECHKK
ncbi:MAG: C-GCAxxG-C-C family (seleno)protein [Nitrospirota bacterium]|jgi:hypothetical protein